MAEPLGPAAVGVASLLKSLRTRAGLREDRLSGTELALDALTGLDQVRELMAAGDSAEHAIVRAVRAAASSLEPTPSIVADVSLSLELSEDALPDQDLYAADLGRRRAALLAHWDRLHELRSAVPASKAPTLRALRFDVEAAALNALAAALTADTSYERPGDQESAGPGSAATSTRERPSGAQLVTGRSPTLLEEFRRISAALRGCLTRDAGGEPQGWPHDLRRRSDSSTAMATAYGIKAMQLLEESLAPDLIPVAEHLKGMEQPGGGYAARAQAGSRPEVTATVLDALYRIDATADFDAQIGAMERELGDFEKERPFVLTSVLETSARLRPDSELTASLTDNLLAVRQRYGEFLLWPEKAEPLLVAPAASTVHTARAVRALAQVQAVRPSARVQEALEQAAGWLAEQADLGRVSEVIDRPLEDGGVEQLYIRHFTAAWVARALVSVGLPASHPSVSSAVSRIWRSYSETAALWSWNNGDLPIWLTFDAIDSLHMTALATTTRAGS